MRAIGIEDMSQHVLELFNVLDILTQDGGSEDLLRAVPAHVLAKWVCSTHDLVEHARAEVLRTQAGAADARAYTLTVVYPNSLCITTVHRGLIDLKCLQRRWFGRTLIEMVRVDPRDVAAADACDSYPDPVLVFDYTGPASARNAAALRKYPHTFAKGGSVLSDADFVPCGTVLCMPLALLEPETVKLIARDPVAEPPAQAPAPSPSLPPSPASDRKDGGAHPSDCCVLPRNPTRAVVVIPPAYASTVLLSAPARVEPVHLEAWLGERRGVRLIPVDPRDAHIARKLLEFHRIEGTDEARELVLAVNTIKSYEHVPRHNPYAHVAFPHTCKSMDAHNNGYPFIVYGAALCMSRTLFDPEFLRTHLVAVTRATHDEDEPEHEAVPAPAPAPGLEQKDVSPFCVINVSGRYNVTREVHVRVERIKQLIEGNVRVMTVDSRDFDAAHPLVAPHKMHAHMVLLVGFHIEINHLASRTFKFTAKGGHLFGNVIYTSARLARRCGFKVSENAPASDSDDNVPIADLLDRARAAKRTASPPKKASAKKPRAKKARST